MLPAKLQMNLYLMDCGILNEVFFLALYLRNNLTFYSL
jgi:hypothetical protein